MSILFEHIILKLMCFLWNSGHFSSHFRTFLVEFCRDRRLRAFFVNSGLFSSHFRTFIVEFCRDRRLRAFPKILKILASSLFSFPCLSQILSSSPDGGDVEGGKSNRKLSIGVPYIQCD